MAVALMLRRPRQRPVCSRLAIKRDDPAGNSSHPERRVHVARVERLTGDPHILHIGDEIMLQRLPEDEE